MRARPGRFRRTGAALTLALVLVGCGIPIDRAPRQLSDADIGPLANTAASGATSSQDGQRVYFLTSSGAGDGFRLQAVSRDVSGDVLSVLSELFKGVTDAEKAPPLRLSSQIPVGTRLLSAGIVTDGAVVVNVDDTIFRGANLYAAVAQIVYTATSVPGVDRVRLLVNGEAKQWPGDDLVERTGDLTPLAYPTLYPVNQPDLPPVPSPTGPTTTPAPATSTTSDASASAPTTTVAGTGPPAGSSTSTGTTVPAGASVVEPTPASAPPEPTTSVDAAAGDGS